MSAQLRLDTESGNSCVALCVGCIRARELWGGHFPSHTVFIHVGKCGCVRVHTRSVEFRREFWRAGSPKCELRLSSLAANTLSH